MNTKVNVKILKKNITLDEIIMDYDIMTELNTMDSILGTDSVKILEDRPNNVSLKTAVNALLEEQIYVSYGMSGKLKNIPAISTSNLVNPRCIARKDNPDLICHYCYADGQQKQYYMSKLHSIRNYYLLTTRLIGFVNLPYIMSDILRLEAFGDIANYAHFINFMNIARRNPHCVVTLWTKNIDIIEEVLSWDETAKPANMILIQSSMKLNSIDTYILPQADHIFTVYTKDFVKEKGDGFINCGGRKCRECMRCYNLENSEFAIAEIKK